MTPSEINDVDIYSLLDSRELRDARWNRGVDVFMFGRSSDNDLFCSGNKMVLLRINAQTRLSDSSAPRKAESGDDSKHRLPV
jgi:hypothetical protein